MYLQTIEMLSNKATLFEGELLICPNEQRSLICSTDYTLLEWSISTINQTIRETRSVPYEGQNPTITSIMINSTNFTFLRVSSQNTLPLVSTMTIMNINSNLEGTMVSCTGISSSSVSSVVLVKVLHIFDVNIDVPNLPDVAMKTKSDMIYFGNNNFTVTLELPQFSGETYTVVTIPEAVHTTFTTNTSVQLVMLYNIQYNVNVTAILCGHRNTTNFTLHYAQCISLLSDTVLSDRKMVISGIVSALQGQNITFSCFGNESWLSHCSEDGRWDPDPTEICKTTEITEFSAQSTITINTTPVANNTQAEMRMANIPLLGSMVGVSFLIIISLMSIVIAAVIILKRRELPNFKKAIKTKGTSDDPSKIQSLTTTQESEVIHEMVHCEADHLGTLVYADVFSSSMICSKVHNQAPKLDDDQVDYAEVNQNIMRPRNINSDVDSLLNLDSLLIQIKRDATQMWYQLGEAFGIEKKILEKYTVCSPEESIIEVLDYWIRNHSGQPTWKEVAEALKKINLHESAEEIEMIYKTGERFVAVNTDLNRVPQELLMIKAAELHNHEAPPPVPPKGL